MLNVTDWETIQLEFNQNVRARASVKRNVVPRPDNKRILSQPCYHIAMPQCFQVSDVLVRKRIESCNTHDIKWRVKVVAVVVVHSTREEEGPQQNCATFCQ